MYAALPGWELNFSQNGAACNREITVLTGHPTYKHAVTLPIPFKKYLGSL